MLLITFTSRNTQSTRYFGLGGIKSGVRSHICNIRDIFRHLQRVFRQTVVRVIFCFIFRHCVKTLSLGPCVLGAWSPGNRKQCVSIVLVSINISSWFPNLWTKKNCHNRLIHKWKMIIEGACEPRSECGDGNLYSNNYDQGWRLTRSVTHWQAPATRLGEIHVLFADINWPYTFVKRFRITTYFN